MAAPMIPPAHAPAFLAANGWGGAEILPLAGDASFRRYFRVVHGDRQAVLMDAPPNHEDVAPFLAIAGHLDRLGLSAPQSHAVDRADGLLLLEDFGDRLVGPLLRAGAEDETSIYRDAITLLARLAEQPVPEGLAPYDMAVLRREIGLFPEWYAPAVGLDIDLDGWARAWDAVLPRVAGPKPPVLVLRDYHVDNIILLDREGLRRLGLLDFQDALAGHPAYDLVSLLQDARRDVAPALEAEMLEAYAAEAGIADAEAFRADYEILGAQRNTKILGIFTRLWKRDGKRNYLPFQPRVWGYLERNLRHPTLAPVAQWFAANVPAASRAAHWTEMSATKFAKPLALRPDPHSAQETPDTAMLMAAGLGKRMRPLTATRPKPLIEVGGRSLLDHSLDRVRAAGVKKVVVNVHYLADALEAHVRRHAADLDVTISDERATLLETGGGVVHALPLLGDKPFFVINSDNLWVDGPVDTLRLLANRWDDERMDALLLVVALARATAHSGQGDFHMDAAGHLRRREPRRIAPFVYTGVQLVSPRLFEDAPEGPFSTNILWDRAIAKGRAFGVVHQGLWCDVGTPAALPLAEELLKGG